MHQLLETDLVIIGGGPGGCAAAISAAEAGLRVVLVERLSFPRHRPGETLPPGVEPLFRQLGVWEEIAAIGFIRHPAQRVVWNGAPVVTPFGGTREAPWLGVQAWRPTLDAILLRRAQSLGVTVKQPCRALAPLTQRGRIVGAVTDDGAIAARFVIEASGTGRWLARHAGQRMARRSPRLIASYGYVETCRAEEWFLPEWRASEQSWAWLAQVQPQVVAWTQLSLAGERLGVPDSLTRLPDARRFHAGGSAADVTWRLADEPAGPGFFRVGDAAFTLDPASAHGVLRGLMSGIMAAHLVSQIVDGRIAGEAAAATYGKWIRSWFDHDASRLREFYRRLPSAPGWVAKSEL